MINGANKRTVSLRIDQSLIEFFTGGTNKNINQSISEALLMYKAMLSEAEFELKKRFMPKEWVAMADCLNGCVIEPTLLSKDTLKAEFEDSQSYDGTFSRHEVVFPLFMRKIDKLTHAQSVALYNRIRKFWNAENADLYAWSQF